MKQTPTPAVRGRRLAAIVGALSACAMTGALAVPTAGAAVPHASSACRTSRGGDVRTCVSEGPSSFGGSTSVIHYALDIETCVSVNGRSRGCSGYSTVRAGAGRAITGLGGSYPADSTACANTYQRKASGRHVRINRVCEGTTTIG